MCSKEATKSFVMISDDQRTQAAAQNMYLELIIVGNTLKYVHAWMYKDVFASF